MTFEPVQNRSRHLQVFNAVKDRILSGKLKCGDRLPAEAKLCEEFRVSRNIVREAIKSLQSIGLLDVSPGKKGTTVSVPDVVLAQELIAIHLRMKNTGIGELFEARLTIEPAIARLAAIRRTEADIEALRRCVEDMDTCRSLARATELDFRFHNVLVDASGNHVFRMYNMPLLSLQRELRRKTLRRKGREVASRHHRALLESVEKRDPESAAAIMTAHIRLALEVLGQADGPNDSAPGRKR